MKNIKRILALFLILTVVFTASIGAVYANGPAGGRNSNSSAGAGDCDRDQLQKRDGSCNDCTCQYDCLCDGDRLRLRIHQKDALEALNAFSFDKELLKAVAQCDSEEELWPLMERIREQIRETSQLKKIDQQHMLKYKEQLKLMLGEALLWKFQLQEQNRIRLRINLLIEEE